MSAPHTDLATAPDWFHNTVVSGLQFLWALGLPGTPAGELATLTAASWVQALWCHNPRWTEKPDAPRLTEAFTTVAGRAERWPTPRTVLDAMPARKQPLALPLRGTPAPPAVREMLARLNSRLPKPKKSTTSQGDAE